MSQEAMEALLNIIDWYSSPSDTFIRMFGRDKPPRILPRFTMEKLVMQEVRYHISTRLSARLHRRKNAPWPALPLRIGLYDIKSLKDVDGEAKEIEKYEFGTKDYNPYDPHDIFMKHYVKVYYPWVHGACHWAEEHPWRYCYNHSKLKEPINIVVEWKASLQEAAS